MKSIMKWLAGIFLACDLKEILKEYGMPIRGVYERSDAKVRQLESKGVNALSTCVSAGSYVSG